MKAACFCPQSLHQDRQKLQIALKVGSHDQLDITCNGVPDPGLYVGPNYCQSHMYVLTSLTLTSKA